MIKVVVYVSHLLGDEDYSVFTEKLPRQRRPYRDPNNGFMFEPSEESVILVINGGKLYERHMSDINNILINHYGEKYIMNFINILNDEVNNRKPLIRSFSQEKYNITMTNDDSQPTYFIHCGAISPPGLTTHFDDGSEMQKACRKIGITNVYTLSRGRSMPPNPLPWPNTSDYEKMIETLEPTETYWLSSLVILCEAYIFVHLESIKNNPTGEAIKLIDNLSKLQIKSKAKGCCANLQSIKEAFGPNMIDNVKKEYVRKQKTALDPNSHLLRLCEVIQGFNGTKINTDNLTPTIVGAYEELAKVLKDSA